MDEIENGLEPHRVIGAIAHLKADQTIAKKAHKPVGQILITTHSDVALGEAGVECLRVIQTIRPGRDTAIARALSPESIRALLRFTPRALFARRILVTEGNTEIGMLLGLRENWPPRHSNKPIEQLGVAIADGNGDQACSMALSLFKLGYQTAMYRDSDTKLSTDNLTDLATAAIPVFEYGGCLNTEQAMFSAASDELVQELLVYARSERGDELINNNIAAKITDLSVEVIRSDFANWELRTALDADQLRGAIADVACGKTSSDKKDKKPWFKDQRIGRGLAPIVWRIATAVPASPLAVALAKTEAWLYA